MFSSKEEFKEAFAKNLESETGKTIEQATEQDAYHVLSQMVRGRLVQKWKETEQSYQAAGKKQVYYFSMEFLMGRLLGNNLLNMGALNVVEEGLIDLGLTLPILEESEADAGLGNGGLGRLAACFLDSLASLGLAGHGVGLRYRNGMFTQRFVNGYQVELPDHWLEDGYAWEVRREEEAIEVSFGGEIESVEDKNGDLHFTYKNSQRVRAVPYDIPVVGDQEKAVNTLRLWSAEPTEEDLLAKAQIEQAYGNYIGHQRHLEEITSFLYPDDSNEEGKKLRLKQEYFLVSAGLQNIVQKYKDLDLPWSDFSKRIALHINDTHPALIVPELMRILMDVEGLGWEEAWTITQSSVSYTNHTTLSEALETWPVEVIRTLLPRIFMIIEEINERFCQSLWEQDPGDFDRIAKLAIIADGNVKMAHLSIVGSHSVNGVARLHTEILKNREMKHFYEAFPERFNNKTNGITHRRWLLHANPSLAELITNTVGEEWKREPRLMKQLLSYREDGAFLDELHHIKQHNKENLAQWIEKDHGISIDPNSIFDVHIKRLHGYKRQLLNALHIMHLYNELKANPGIDMTPRTFIFGAKAAPGYYFAKKVIKLINTIAEVVNQDPVTKDTIKVVFMEDYSVSLAEKIIPATNVSEQISTASKEASGTGNMKLMMNGAITLGTMDGANVEIHEEVGNDAIYTFGLSSEEVLSYYHTGAYDAKEMYEGDQRIRRVVDQLFHYSPFSKGDTTFHELYHALVTNNDEYFLLKDFNSYVEAQKEISHDYANRRKWNEMSLMNIAHSGRFSSDYTIENYANEIWNMSGAKLLNG
ncbi:MULTISPECIES: glycogen/starch/alpha-glucan phosphorylase [Pontibacillus]|uniref:Alpha-1,4 glucan phosphorylase n=1 Tax=Pontibacillus chungwhensis TaxID=265426 RepID=A0ABY8UZW5_9BACI|nr:MULTISPECIES: glycogen/starch/alpha-glucan phosphorylase [Pontibacillus]MCD5325674.1 glycogen/starch/alpha-glucan phosphorylase [Pontibacillus sp. HN14]WIF98084.1 glycogen/starch/alpha-glucan phosphorylase [Pontibacillus chungwhensis]